MTNPKTVIVTGANRGIGLAICETILKNHSPVNLYACSRAGKDLNFQSEPSKDPKNNTITYQSLDITSSSSIKDLAQKIRSSESGKVDILINNAGTNLDASGSSTPIDPAKTQQVIDTNYTGTLNMCQTFIPLMSSHGRIVNVSSVGSSLHIYSKDIQSRFRDSNITLQGISQLISEYTQAVKQAAENKQSAIDKWGNGKGYAFSKACVNAMTSTLANENPDLLINCCCPGWVDTEMGKMVGQPSKTPEQGAKIPLKLAYQDLKGVTGRYWSNPGVNDTEDGRVTTW